MKINLKSLVGVLSVAATAVSVTSCSQSEEMLPVGNTRAANVVTVSGVINTNMTWSASNEYHLNGLCVWWRYIDYSAGYEDCRSVQ